MKSVKILILCLFVFSFNNLTTAQENENTTINKDSQEHQRLRNEKAKAEHLQNDPNSTNSRADENKLVSKPYFLYRNQVLDGMNVVGKGIIRKFDRELTNVENIRALNEWVIENKELFKPEFLEKSNEYFIEALKE
ncbi:MAG TPA: hypothetical protein VFD77_00635 [Brumimicrobium sp.]|nr:hypothetical protein [Brumimicrobium sp.]